MLNFIASIAEQIEPHLLELSSYMMSSDQCLNIEQVGNNAEELSQMSQEGMLETKYCRMLPYLEFQYLNVLACWCCCIGLISTIY